MSSKGIRNKAAVYPINAGDTSHIHVCHIICDILKERVLCEISEKGKAKFRCPLKALLNNVSTLKTSELHGPTCYQCLWEGVKMKPWKNCASKASLSASKKWLDLPHSFSPFKRWLSVKFPPQKGKPTIRCPLKQIAEGPITTHPRKFHQDANERRCRNIRGHFPGSIWCSGSVVRKRGHNFVRFPWL